MHQNQAIADVALFNGLAGNTDSTFNIRQSALYFGLQLEEMAEKFRTLGFTGTHVVDIERFADKMKKGEYDDHFIGVDRRQLLDDDVDQFVVTIGSMLSQGADVIGAINEVNRANLSKRFDDGLLHKNDHGKIIKPEGWTDPDLSPFVCKD